MLNLYSLYPVIKWPSRKVPRALDVPLDPKDKLGISVLVPAYREEEVLSQSLKCIFASRYPRELLEVIVLVEPEDETTLRIARDCATRLPIQVAVVCDDGAPKGKPRALNQGAMMATKEIIGVIDAEDIIDPDLFSTVSLMIGEYGYDVVQGILDMKNEEDGWMNRSFRAEYGWWYRAYLPMISASGLPVPLGGTTNFFKRSVLEEVGFWDANNVTEDFDLGLRLFAAKKRFGTLSHKMLSPGTNNTASRQGYNVGLFGTVTEEESPVTLTGWVKQRTRWEKGKMQTLAKFVRVTNSSRVVLTTGVTGLFAFVGVLNITGIMLSLLSYVCRIPYSGVMRALALFNVGMLVYHCGTQSAGYMMTSKGRKRWILNAVLVGMVAPIYWFLQWVAGLRASWQILFGSRVFWEKTPHFGRHIAFENAGSISECARFEDATGTRTVKIEN